jgi:stage II sporulation protein D
MLSYIKDRPWRLIILFVFLVSGCLRTVPGQAGGGERIRVLIMKGVPSLELKGTDRGSLIIRYSGAGTIRVNGKQRALPLRLFPDGGHIFVEGRPYRGTIEIADGKQGLLVINEVPIEAYLAGIINNEISSKWPEDVIKTQAVIARTYALFNRNKRAGAPWHVESSVMGQVYSGAAAEDMAAVSAVRATAGEVLMYADEPALTVYHSNAGGMTEASRAVWSRDYPYLVSVESPFDSGAPRYQWDYTASAAELGERLRGSGRSIGDPKELEVVETTPAGRVKALAVRDAQGREIRVTGEELRSILGYSVLRSAMFGVERGAEMFIFRGRGSGHGVGLSQWGAKGMAEKGYSYRQILLHFYPGTELTKVW